MNDCPCGMPTTYTDCCGRFLRGSANPDTAEELMRSRFTAHVKKNWGYLLKTLCADERKNETVNEMDSGAEWTRLEILSNQQGELDDQHGEVVFAAHFNDGEQDRVHRETARFQRENGKWVYAGERSKVEPLEVEESVERVKTFVRDQPKVGRNDPCPCQSGKKFKKCCGK